MNVSKQVESGLPDVSKQVKGKNYPEEIVERIVGCGCKEEKEKKCGCDDE